MAFVIMDFETDGLAPTASILEISYVIVDHLRQARPHHIHTRLVYHDPSDVTVMMQDCDPVVLKMHTESGLWAALVNPDSILSSLEMIEEEIVGDLLNWGDPEVVGPHYLVGNSIRADRAWVEAQMPGLAYHLHYRQVDLTSFDLQLQDEGMPSTKEMRPGIGHRSHSDLEDTIVQLHRQQDLLRAVHRFGADHLLRLMAQR